MSNAPTLINLPPPPADSHPPSDVPSRSGTPNSTTTSMSELSTVAIKDGHRGHLPHHHGHTTLGPSSAATNTLDAERADRISRLAGLERVTTARNPTPSGNLTPSITAPPLQGAAYFDAQGNAALPRERSTVGSASATGSVGGRTTWAGSEAGEVDKMSESQDMDLDASSVGGLSEEGNGSLVGFGEGARTPARQQSTMSSLAPGQATPTARDAKMLDAGVDTTASEVRPRGAAQTAEQIVRENMDLSSADRMMQNSRGSAPGQDGSGLGKFAFEK